MTDRIGSPARLAIVGAGAIAESYLRALETLSGAELVALADVDQTRAQTIAGRLNVPAFGGHRELLATVPCDAIVVCTPPAYHMEVAIDALRSGVHVLCEKPLSIGAFAARRMYAAALENGRVLTMASKFRFFADIVRAKALMLDGAVGKVLRVENTFMSRVDMTGRWNSRVETSGGGVIIDNGTHSVDIMRFLLGPLTAAYAVDTSTDSRYDGCDESASLFVRNAAGIVGAIGLSWSFAAPDGTFLRILGTEGRIEVGWAGAACTRGEGEAVNFGTGYDKLRSLAAQIENFIAAVRGEAPPAVSREDAIASVEVIDAAYDSVRRSAWSAVELRRLTPFERLIAVEGIAAGAG
ncbi:MAG: Gfo/Idh/MocA family oxidoreductase [Candidatus Velthaea sp.]|jgi:predicted dehydrogenase